MASTGKYILGGLLGGLGEGMVLQGKAKREAMLEKLRQDHDVMMEGIRHQNNMAEQDDRQEFEAGESQKGRDFDATEAQKGRDFDASESLKEREHESKEGALDRAADLKKGLLGDLVEVADPDNPGRTKMVPKSEAAGMPGKSSTDAMLQEQSDRELAAEEQAIAEAKEKGGMAGPFDDSDFPEDGSREAFIQRRKKEILDGKTTDTPRSAGDGGEAAGARGGVDPATEQKPGKVKGAGTRADPYKPMSKADRDKLPAGSYYLDPNGTMRQKS
jgi:hypothetical protein